MNPSIDSGSITIVKKMDMYEVGDVISYYYDSNNTEEIISHRIIQIGGNVYITKGDANLGIDAQGVVPRLIIGKVVMIIPYLGYIVSFAKSTLGVWITIIAPACFISGTELTKVWIALKKPEEK